jgi:hypothetical protein
MAMVFLAHSPPPGGYPRRDESHRGTEKMESGKRI